MVRKNRLGRLKACNYFRGSRPSLEPSRSFSVGRTSLRQWFADFAWLRNRTRGHGALLPGPCEALVQDLEPSLRSIGQNLAILGLPSAFVRQNLSGKYRVSSICGPSDDFNRLKSDSSAQLQNGVYISIGQDLRRVSLISSDPDLTDFFLPNGNFREVGKSAKYELISYHTDRTIEGDGLEFISPTSSLPESDTQGQLTLDMIGSTFSNAPTPAVDYVSRTVLEKEILALLRDERHSIVTMVGRGGIGKTSLAVTVLRELAEAGDFFATFWFSARDIDLLAEGPKLVKPGVLSTEDIAREYLSLVNGDWCRATGSLRMGGVSGDGLGEDVGSGWLVGVVRLDA